MNTSFPKPNTSVDTILFARRARELQVQLRQRPHVSTDPFPGQWALPGGYVHIGNDHQDTSLEDTVKRVLTEKTEGNVRYTEQLCTVGGPHRDPRGWSLSVAYIVLVEPPLDLNPEKGLCWAPVDRLPKLAFDHEDLIRRGVERLRNKSQYSSLPAFLLPDTFTFPELLELYQDILGTPLDQSAFRRKMTDQGLIEEADGSKRVASGAGRPAQLYRLARANLHDFGRTLGPASPTEKKVTPKRGR